jgi:Family of unknown function (DUF6152)
MLRWLALAGSFAAPLSATAHHSMSMFDRSSPMTLDGVVTRYEWANPHVYVFVDVAADAGKRIVWAVEGQPPTILKRQGWSEDTLTVGDHVVVDVFGPKDSRRNIALGRVVHKADGTRLSMSFDAAALSKAGPVPPSTAIGLSGTWSTVLAPSVARPFLVGPVPRPDLNLKTRFDWSLTEKGRQAVESFRQESMLPGIECIPYTSPFLMVIPGIKTIDVGDNLVRIRSEFEGVERTVHMRERSHDGAAVSRQGHSIGRWEDGVLVIDTRGFSDHAAGNAVGLPSSASKHLVERLQLNPDGRSLTYRFQLEDPEYLAEPVTGEVQWAYEPGATYSPAACNLDDARRFIGE